MNDLDSLIRDARPNDRPSPLTKRIHLRGLRRSVAAGSARHAEFPSVAVGNLGLPPTADAPGTGDVGRFADVTDREARGRSMVGDTAFGEEVTNLEEAGLRGAVCLPATANVVEINGGTRGRRAFGPAIFAAAAAVAFVVVGSFAIGGFGRSSEPATVGPAAPTLGAAPENPPASSVAPTSEAVAPSPVKPGPGAGAPAIGSSNPEFQIVGGYSATSTEVGWRLGPVSGDLFIFPGAQPEYLDWVADRAADGGELYETRNRRVLGNDATLIFALGRPTAIWHMGGFVFEFRGNFESLDSLSAAVDSLFLIADTTWQDLGFQTTPPATAATTTTVLTEVRRVPLTGELVAGGRLGEQRWEIRTYDNPGAPADSCYSLSPITSSEAWLFCTQAPISQPVAQFGPAARNDRQMLFVAVVGVDTAGATVTGAGMDLGVIESVDAGDVGFIAFVTPILSSGETINIDFLDDQGDTIESMSFTGPLEIGG